MPTMPAVRTTRVVCCALLGLTLLTLAGCQRSQEVHDDRTLEKRSHVETVAPQDRKDAFRP